MRELKIFENPEFGQMRTAMDDHGSPLFCGTDVARALGYTNPHKALADHCKGVTKREGISQTTNQHGTTTNQVTVMNFIPESDVYRLIIRSKLPSAQKFEAWVMEDVLPSIRRHGMYATPLTVERLLSDPDTMIQLLTELKHEREERKQLEAENSKLAVENQIMLPKADYFDGAIHCHRLEQCGLYLTWVVCLTGQGGSSH